MHTEIIITTEEPSEIYDILTAMNDGSFETIGPGFKFMRHETGPRQYRHAAQLFEYLATTTERRRRESGHCPSDNLKLDADGLCPNSSCIHSRLENRVK